MNESTDLEIIKDSEIESISPETLSEYDTRINRCLEIIQNISVYSVELWTHIKWFKDTKTYKLKGYETFNDFCRQELGKDNSQIYRYIKDSEFKEALLLKAETNEERTSILSLKESNTRFIRTLPEEAQIPFWKLAYSVGSVVLTAKEDGSIEPTTGFLEDVGDQLDEIIHQGGMHLDGEFYPLAKIDETAKILGVEEDTARALFLSAGVSDAYFEALKRQEVHIKNKTAKYDHVSLRGAIEMVSDDQGIHPILLDEKGNELNLAEVLLGFVNREVTLSIKSPIKRSAG